MISEEQMQKSLEAQQASFMALLAGMQKDWMQTGNDDRRKWLEDRITEFTYDPDDGFTFDMWFRQYELLFEREGKSLSDGEKVEILLLKLGRMEHEKYVKFVLPKKPAEIEFTETVLKDILYTALEDFETLPIVNATTVHAHFNECDNEFFAICDVQLDKINNFFEEKLTEAKRKFVTLKQELERCFNSRRGRGLVLKFKSSSNHQQSKSVDNTKRSRPSLSFEFGSRATKSQIGLRNGKINDMEGLLRRRNTVLQRTSDKSIGNLLGKEPPSPIPSLHNLKLAYSEYYLSLVLLQKYQTLNGTGFRKILKKHDKLFQRVNGLQWYNQVVLAAPFYVDKTVDDLIAAIETIYIQDLEKGDRQKAMKRLRVPPLAHTAEPRCVFRVGLFAGIFLVEILVAIVSVVYVEQQSFSWPAFTIFRTTLLVTYYTCLLAVNLYGWQSSGVNHVLVFEIDPRSHMDHFQMLEFGLLLADLWGAFVIMYIFSPHIGVPQFAPPFVLVVLMFAYLLSPLPFLHYKARRWVLKIFWRVLRAPCTYVNFSDFFMADQLYSFPFIFPDMAFFLCFYGSYFDWPSMNVKQSLKNATITPPGKSPYFAPKTTCDGPLFGLTPVLRSLPAWFRFAQCIRRYHDLAVKDPSPHLYNAAKYSTVFFVATFSTWAELNPKSGVFAYNPFTITMMVISSILNASYTFSWDIIVDWGLLDFKAKDNPGLRDELVYRFRAYYYCAIFEDMIIRFSWTLTALFQYTYPDVVEVVRTVVYFAEVSRCFHSAIITLSHT
nr:unnamed protein product [Spirometra erinaceieuropaei]